MTPSPSQRLRFGGRYSGAVRRATPIEKYCQSDVRVTAVVVVAADRPIFDKIESRSLLYRSSACAMLLPTLLGEVFARGLNVNAAACRSDYARRAGRDGRDQRRKIAENKPRSSKLESRFHTTNSRRCGRTSQRSGPRRTYVACARTAAAKQNQSHRVKHTKIGITSARA